MGVNYAEWLAWQKKVIREEAKEGAANDSTRYGAYTQIKRT